MTGSDSPVCRIIAGPNGAGKTTFALRYLPAIAVTAFVNADLIAAGLSPLAPEQQHCETCSAITALPRAKPSVS